MDFTVSNTDMTIISNAVDLEPAIVAELGLSGDCVRLRVAITEFGTANVIFALPTGKSADDYEVGSLISEAAGSIVAYSGDSQITRVTSGTPTSPARKSMNLVIRQFQGV